jgi:hypothetical protein
VLVAKLTVAETTSYGVLAYAFGVFVLPMQHDLGWSRTALTGAYSLAIVLSGVAAAALRTATGNYRLVMVGVALCASFAMTRAHRLQGRQAVRSTV